MKNTPLTYPFECACRRLYMQGRILGASIDTTLADTAAANASRAGASQKLRVRIRVERRPLLECKAVRGVGVRQRGRRVRFGRVLLGHFIAVIAIATGATVGM
jgi:hypothetical protein